MINVYTLVNILYSFAFASPLIVLMGWLSFSYIKENFKAVYPRIQENDRIKFRIYLGIQIPPILIMDVCSALILTFYEIISMKVILVDAIALTIWIVMAFGESFVFHLNDNNNIKF